MPTPIPDAELRARRERIVLDHFADEVRQDFDAVLSTFPHPRYELIATGHVFDGHDDVRRYYAQSRRPSPTSAARSSSCATPTMPWWWSSGCSARTGAT